MKSLSLRRLPGAFALAQQGVEEALHPGLQVFVWQNGEVLVDDALGEARPGRPMTSESINLWMSATKPLTAVAMAQLWERGLVNLDEPVAHILPEFAENGKERVTLNHLLTHTSCIPRFDEKEGETWEETLQRICALPLEKGCVPGETAAYHATSSWYVLGEVIRRVDGRGVDRYLHDEVFAPLDMQSWSLGVSKERQSDVGERIAWMFRRTLPSGELTPIVEFNRESGVRAIRPASNGRGTARHLANFYRMLMDGGVWQGRRLLEARTVKVFTSPARVGLHDKTFGHTIDWGLGFIVDSSHYGAERVPYGFGLHASSTTFGHGGRESSVAFADPENQLVVAAVFNGMPGEVRHQQRVRGFLTDLYTDLGIQRTR